MGSSRCSVWQAVVVSATQNRDAAVAKITPAGDDADLRILDLAGPGFAAQLPHRLDHMRNAQHMRLRQQPAVGVDRQASTKLDAAVIDEGADIAAVEETRCFDLMNHFAGKKVINLFEVDL